jgi:uncharacterized protein YukE
MYGETDVMRRRVGQLREQGVDIRQLADQLVATTDSVSWTGRAAAAMRERARERATALRECAQHYDAAADALDRHADDVDHLKDAIAQRERKAGALVADARGRATRTDSLLERDTGPGPSEEDPQDRLLTGFAPPPSGHRDWLTVELPGL